MNATRRAPVHRIAVETTGEVFECAEDSGVLMAMERARCAAIPVGCRNGGCGACKVRVVSGAFATAKMNRAVLSQAEAESGCALACRVYPRADLRIVVLGRAWSYVQPHRYASSGLGFTRTTPNPQPDEET